MTTTGEDVVVTMANAQVALDAWQLEEYYDGSAQRLVERYGGIGLDVETVPEFHQSDFCEALRYSYGACINLRQSRAVDPKKLIGTKDGKP